MSKTEDQPSSMPRDDADEFDCLFEDDVDQPRASSEADGGVMGRVIVAMLQNVDFSELGLDEEPTPKEQTQREQKPDQPIDAPVDLDPDVCPEFKSGTPNGGPRATLRAPVNCRNVAAVVAAFNAGRDFVFTNIASANNGMSAGRDELWADGCRAFIVYYHNGERMMGLVPVGRGRSR